MTDRIRVLIVDDHTIVRTGLRLLLEAEADISVVGEALNGLEAVKMVELHHPDVVLMDIAMPEMDGLEATRQVKARWPEVKVLILTMHRSDEYFFEVLRAGASGYILKGAETGDLIHAVRVVGRGEVFLYPSLAQLLIDNFLKTTRWEEGAGSLLSRREKEILRLICEGCSTKEIAEKLVISLSTVHTHRSNIMEKLGVNNQHELIQYARQTGLIQDS